MGVDISRVRRRLFLISFIELFLNFRCDDAFGTMSPLSLPSPASKVVLRGRNPGSCMMCGRVVPTWSNPSGAVLVEVAGGKVWAAERPFMWNSVDVGPPRAPGGGLCFLTHPIVSSVRIGCGVVQTHALRPDGGRMAVVKLADGSLWVHSPVELDAPLRQALEELGPVGHIVSPNYEHVKYAQQWVEAFPSARSYACPGLIERRPEIGFGREVGNVPGDKTPPEWGGEIEACFVDCEKNPFTGKPFFNEVVFFHRPSRALITADLFWNYPRSVPFKTRAWKWGMDKVYHPFYKRFMIIDKAGFDAKVKSILDWGIEVIIPCHGDVVRNGASEALRDMLLGAGPH